MPTDGQLAASAVDANVQDLRAWLRQLSDTELRRFGRAAQYMCSGKAQPRPGDLPHEHYVLHVEEAGAEYN